MSKKAEKGPLRPFGRATKMMGEGASLEGRNVEMGFILFLIGVGIVCFFIACIAPGAFASNFRNTLRVLFFTLATVAIVSVIVSVIFLSLRQPEAQRPVKEVRQQEDRQQREVEAQLQAKAEETRRQAEEVRQQREVETQLQAKAEETRRQAEEVRQQQEVEAQLQADAEGKAQEARRWRVWTIDGESLEARFQKQVLKTVYLLDRQGNVRTVQASSLSAEDRNWIKRGAWK